MADAENMDNLSLAANNGVQLVPETIVTQTIDDEIDLLSLNISANNQTDVEVEIVNVSSNNDDVEMDPSLMVEPEPQKGTRDDLTRSFVNDESEADIVVEPEPQKCTRRSLENAEPERKSARLANRKGSSMVDEVNENAEKVATATAGNRIWKRGEKEQLLSGVKIHGSKNWKKVASHVPTKSEDLVKAYINREKRNHMFNIKTTFKQNDNTEVIIDDGEKKSQKKSRKLQTKVNEQNDEQSINREGQVEETLVRRKKNAPIEQWLEIIDNQNDETSGLDYSSVLPTSLNWIADNELHPDPEDSGGIDYASIYRYLACLCQGEAPPDLDPPTASRVAGLLPMLVATVKNTDMRKEGEWLENYTGVDSASSYVREDGFDGNSEAVKNMDSLSRIPGLNPLGIDAEVCVDRGIPLQETFCGNVEDGVVQNIPREL